MSGLPADHPVRERALDVTRSFIVQAPAGSGKTELLIQRYLALLARVQRPESVLAITFTRKAAAEMRRRVLAALEQAGGPQPEPPHQRRTWKLAAQARRQDQELRWNLTENPHRLHIRTIDSFCAALVRRMPWLSRMGAPPDIAEQPDEIYRAAARATVALVEDDCWNPTLARLLLHLDNDTAALENLLAALLARRDQWLRHLGAGREGLEAALAAVIREQLRRTRDEIPPELAATIAAALEIDALPGCELADLPVWKQVAEKLLTQSGAWRKQMLRKAPALNRGEALRLRLLTVRDLPPPKLTEPQWEAAQAVLQALRLAAAQLKIEFRLRRQADYIEVMEAALRALGDPTAPTDLMLTLDASIEHILVDEFQDTSLTQFRLLEALTAGWTPGDGRTLFLVGDPMQSIYRFREAEVGLFLRAMRDGVGGVWLEPLRLTVNFRSDRSVVDWVNEAFRSVLAPEDDIATGAVRFTASEARPDAPPGVRVCVHPFFEPAWDEEARRVVEVVKQVRAQRPEARIAVLVRARSHLPVLLRALRCADLRYRAVEIETLGEVPVVQDLLALTRALLHPADRVAWLAVLRAPWCGLTLADLHALAGDDHQAAVWDLIQEPTRMNRLSESSRLRLGRTREALAAAMAHRPASLRSWIESAWLALGGPACATAPGDLENAEAYFDLLEELAEGDDVDLELLAERVLQLYAHPDPDADESLQVMTIHKAKGLEFDVVIVPGLGRRPKRDSKPLLAWLEDPGDTESARLLLAPISARGGEQDALYEYIRKVEKAKAEYEDERLLYVAATRARSELHLLGHAKRTQSDKGLEVKPAAGSLLAKLWPAVHPEFERAAREQASALQPVPVAAAPRCWRRLPADWRRPEPPPEPARFPQVVAPEPRVAETPVVFWRASPTLRHVGTVVHRLLHRIGRDGLALWNEERVREQRDLYRRALRELGVPADELEVAAAKVEDALLAVLRDPRGRWILSEQHAEAQSEYPLSGIIEGELVQARLDRTFVDPSGIRWIIDFKTAEHEGGSQQAFLDRQWELYRPQLERYAALMARLDPRPIRLGLYFPLLGAWREWGAERPEVAASVTPAGAETGRGYP